MKSAKITVALVLSFAICFSFCGCRVRTTIVDNTKVTSSSSSSQERSEPLEKQQGKATDSDQNEVKPDKTPVTTAHIVDNSNKKAKPKQNSKANSASAKKDKNAVRHNRVEDNDADVVVKDDGENSNSGTNGGNPGDSIGGNINGTDDSDQSNREDLNKTDEELDQSAVQLAVQKYDSLVSMNNAEIYECQKLRVYVELEQDYVSVNRDNYIHSIILDAGGYNVAEIKYSAIDNNWIENKNPDMIVKIADSTVLGKNTTDTNKAVEIANSILTRDGFAGITAVNSKNILILSKELFETDAGKKAAKLYLAKAMYPALYGDLDVMQAFSEMAGMQIEGIYAYSLNDIGN